MNGPTTTGVITTYSGPESSASSAARAVTIARPIPRASPGRSAAGSVRTTSPCSCVLPRNASPTSIGLRDYGHDH